MRVSEIGLGCMGMTHAYGVPDETESVATIHHAVEFPGTKRRKYLEENLGAVTVALDAAEMQALDDALPPGRTHGFRYGEEHRALVDR